MSSWTLQHVEFLLEHRMAERPDLEFKEALPESSDDVAAWIAAMANSSGGAIVFGVEEDAQGRAVRPSGLGISLDGATAVTRDAARSIDEPVAVRCTTIEDQGVAEGFGYAVVEVDASARAPHFVAGVAWGRTEHGIRRLRRAEIARLFARSDGFVRESGLAGRLRRPANIVADIQRFGHDRVLMFENVGERPAFGVHWSHLAGRGRAHAARERSVPGRRHAPGVDVRGPDLLPARRAPATIQVSCRDDRNALRQTLVVVT